MQISHMDLSHKVNPYNFSNRQLPHPIPHNVKPYDYPICSHPRELSRMQISQMHFSHTHIRYTVIPFLTYRLSHMYAYFPYSHPMCRHPKQSSQMSLTHTIIPYTPIPQSYPILNYDAQQFVNRLMVYISSLTPS